VPPNGISPIRAGRISYDAIFHADGRLAEGYIALAEVQGYVYAGKRLAARCAARLGNSEMAYQLEAEAKLLAERFEEAFWCDDLGTCALALDGAKEPCRARTSNARQLLFSGMVLADRARLVAADLMRPLFLPVGASAPWRAVKHVTIRCPIITGRSGRTTTR
jgi:glycogen debranching enzyme